MRMPRPSRTRERPARLELAMPTQRQSRGREKRGRRPTGRHLSAGQHTEDPNQLGAVVSATAVTTTPVSQTVESRPTALPVGESTSSGVLLINSISLTLTLSLSLSLSLTLTITLALTITLKLE